MAYLYKYLREYTWKYVSHVWNTKRMIKWRTSTRLSETLTLNGPLYPRLTILTLIHALMLLFLSLLLLILFLSGGLLCRRARRRHHGRQLLQRLPLRAPRRGVLQGWNDAEWELGEAHGVGRAMTLAGRFKIVQGDPGGLAITLDSGPVCMLHWPWMAWIEC